MNAANFSRFIAYDINAHVTVNARALQLRIGHGIFARSALADAIAPFLRLQSRWMIKRDVPWVAIWAREFSREIGEHWHLGLHLPRPLRSAYLAQLAAWTGAEQSATDGLSQGTYWHLSDTWKRGGGPEGLAA